MCLKNGTMEL